MAWALIGLSLSDKQLKHVSEAASAKEMGKMGLNILELHLQLKKLAARRKAVHCIPAYRKESKSLWFYVSRMKQLEAGYSLSGLTIKE